MTRSKFAIIPFMLLCLLIGTLKSSAKNQKLKKRIQRIDNYEKGTLNSCTLFAYDKKGLLREINQVTSDKKEYHIYLDYKGNKLAKVDYNHVDTMTYNYKGKNMIIASSKKAGLDTLWLESNKLVKYKEYGVVSTYQYDDAGNMSQMIIDKPSSVVNTLYFDDKRSVCTNQKTPFWFFQTMTKDILGQASLGIVNNVVKMELFSAKDGVTWIMNNTYDYDKDGYPTVFYVGNKKDDTTKEIVYMYEEFK